MRYVTEIEISAAILHILDPRGRGLFLSEAPMDLAGNDRLADYFKYHIRHSLDHSATKAACFRSESPSSPFSICKDLFDGSISMTEGSQALAKKLYEILDRDKRTKVGDLVVCFYHADNYPGERFLALLKIDPSEVFRHVEKIDHTGKKYITFEIEHEAFTEEKLQKSAFIRSPDERKDYDMMVLDYEARNRRRRDVARYFIQDFLDARLASDSTERTKTFYRTTIQALNELRPELSPAEYSNVRLHLDSAMTSETVDVDDWTQQLPLPADKKERVLDTFRQRLPDRSFTPDSKVASSLLKKRRFRGQYGLRVQVDADRYDLVIKSVEQVENDAGKPPYFRVTIETEKWDEVIR